MLRVGPGRHREEGRPGPADQQEHLHDEPPRAPAPAHRRAARQPERGARRAREGRPGPRHARRAHSSSTSSRPSARSGSTTSSTSRRGRWSGTWGSTDERLGSRAGVPMSGSHARSRSKAGQSCVSRAGRRRGEPADFRRFLAEFQRARDLMYDLGESRRITGIRNFRQALASPYPASHLTIRRGLLSSVRADAHEPRQLSTRSLSSPR